MYKNKSTIVSDVTGIDEKKFKFVNLYELAQNTIQKRGEEINKNINSQVDQNTPIVEVHRYSRITRPPQHYSHTLNYIMLTDGGEPESYDKSLQDKNSSMRELAVKNEIDFLLGNQIWKLTELTVGKKSLHNKWLYK